MSKEVNRNQYKKVTFRIPMGVYRYLKWYNRTYKMSINRWIVRALVRAALNKEK